MPRKINFHINNRCIPNRSGVYIVHDEVGVLDVGESGRVGKRIKRHERRVCWARSAVGEVRVSVVWTPYKKRAGRRAIECELRDELDPECGDR